MARNSSTSNDSIENRKQKRRLNPYHSLARLGRMRILSVGSLSFCIFLITSTNIICIHGYPCPCPCPCPSSHSVSRRPPKSYHDDSFSRKAEIQHKLSQSCQKVPQFVRPKYASVICFLVTNQQDIIQDDPETNPTSSSSAAAAASTTTATTIRKSVDSLTVPILACSSTIEVLRAVSMYVHPGDTVLELGAQLSKVSTQICQRIGSTGKAILVDVQRSEAKTGRTIHRNVNAFLPSTVTTNLYPNKSSNQDDTSFPPQPQDAGGDSKGEQKLQVSQESFGDFVHFLSIDHFHEWRNALYDTKNYQPILFQVMVLDIGATVGNDLTMTALALTNEFIHQQRQLHHHQQRMTTEGIHPPPLRAILIKSRNLSSLARRLVHFQRLMDGSYTLPMPRAIRSQHPIIIATVGVNEYRRTIPHVVQKGDACIEVGCHFGRTTSALYHAAVAPDPDPLISTTKKGFCIGIDIGPKIIANAKKQLPYIHFAVADAWNVLDLMKLKIRYDHTDPLIETADSLSTTHSTISGLGYDIVYADIGGLSGADGVLETLALLETLSNGLQPRYIVVKSLCLNRLASQLKAFSTIWAHQKQDDEISQPIFKSG